MTITEAYLKFTEKVNKNFTNDNISVDKPRFIMLFNEYQDKYVEYVLDKRNEDDIRYIQRLVVSDKKLNRNGGGLFNINYDLPKDYFDFIDAKLLISTKDCNNIYVGLYEVKQENINYLLQDEHNKPDLLKYRETFYTFGGNRLQVYMDTGDYKNIDAYLTYYRKPIRVDIEGYLDILGHPTTNIDPEFDDKVVNRILSACAYQFDVNNNELQRAQFEKSDIYNKI